MCYLIKFSLQELFAGIPIEQKEDAVSRIYGQHGFARWFERHFYDWFHDPDDTYVFISQTPSPRIAAEDAGDAGTTSAAEQKVVQKAEHTLLVRYGVRPPSPPPQPKMTTSKEPSSATTASSPGVSIQESEASVKHSNLLP